MIAFTPIIIFVVATALALLSSIYFWQKSKAISLFILGWYFFAQVLNGIGFFPGQGTWVEGDLVRMVAYSMAMFLPVLVYFWALSRSNSLREAIEAVPTPVLAGSQIYRISGATFLLAYLHGVFPGAMAIPAAVLDTFIGITALPLAYLLMHKPVRRLTIGWNLVGLFDFALAFSLVSASLFGIIAITPAPSAIGQAPSVLISLFQVPFAMIVHFEMLRRLFAKEIASINPTPNTL